jgi:hypothetical protein
MQHEVQLPVSSATTSLVFCNLLLKQMPLLLQLPLSAAVACTVAASRSCPRQNRCYNS